MSISELLDDVPHPWANLRVNDLTVDGDFINNNNNSLEQEELLMSVIYGGTLWTTTKNKTIMLNKIGRTCTLHMEEAIDVSTGAPTPTILVDTPIPEIFRPNKGDNILITDYVSKISGYTANGYEFAYLKIDEDGYISIIFNNAPNGVMCGINNYDISWITD
ncbi:MAG TPA: hypothetical protein VLZ83_14070 [Edaphocola sp.]|nr:hypothetical protein [Edaphocola sp.]